MGRDTARHITIEDFKNFDISIVSERDRLSGVETEENGKLIKMDVGGSCYFKKTPKKEG